MTEDERKAIKERACQKCGTEMKSTGGEPGACTDAVEWCPTCGDPTRIELDDEDRAIIDMDFNRGIAASASIVDQLRADIERLRGLIKEAEWNSETVDDEPICPWCLAPTNYQTSTASHMPDCPAFTPEGVVR